MTLHPARSLVVCALVASIAGCAETHERVEEETSVMDDAFVWSDTLEIFGASDSRTLGYHYQVLALEDAFIVVYTVWAPDGSSGITMSSFDWDGNLLVDRVDLTSGSTFESVAYALAPVASGDGTWSLYWATFAGTFGWLRVSAQGEVLRGPEMFPVGLLGGDSGIEVMQVGTQTFLVCLLGTNEYALVPIEADGSLGTPQRIESWAEPFTPLFPTSHNDRVQVAWTARQRGADDVVFATAADWSTGISEAPRERYRAGVAQVTAVFLANDSPWLEVTTLDSGLLIDLEANTPPFTFMRGTNGGSRWHARETEVLAVTSSDLLYGSIPTRLVFRRIDLRARRVMERTPIAESACGIWRPDTAMDGALGVVWMDYCDGGFLHLSMHARVRRPR